MNIEKLNPWNWFKHESLTNSQIPVKKSDAASDLAEHKDSQMPGAPSSVRSLLQLHNELDRVFENVWRSFGNFPSMNIAGGVDKFNNFFNDKSIFGDYRANLDVSGSEKEYEISIDLPGLSENDLNIELHGNVLTIRGQKEESSEDKTKHYYRMERSVGTFQRTLSLPEDANKESIDAEMKNGVLTLRIERIAKPETAVKKIAINS